MDSGTKAALEKLALERLEATAEDDEQWSFLFRTEGSVSFTYCPWEMVEEFDGDVDGLNLSWSEARLELIESGEAEPNKKEFAEWQRARAQQLADGSEYCQVAWIVPLVMQDQTEGWALFLCGEDPNETPELKGVFESADDAKLAIASEGVIASAQV